MIPHYWHEATQALAAQDAVMADLIARYPNVSLRSRGDAFGTLARSIVGQQISVKAADTIWGRFAAVVGEVTPLQLLAVGSDGLQGCGLSQRKIEYVLDLAQHFASGTAKHEAWPEMDDGQVIAALTDVRGIGRWTAEMFLIFTLMRPDVYPLDDIGLQRAVAQLYLQGERPTRNALVEQGRRWQPWRTVATWYLWRSLDPVPVEY